MFRSAGQLKKSAWLESITLQNRLRLDSIKIRNSINLLDILMAVAGVICVAAFARQDRPSLKLALAWTAGIFITSVILPILEISLARNLQADYPVMNEDFPRELLIDIKLFVNQSRSGVHTCRQLSIIW